jgi:hypothetical protein
MYKNSPVALKEESFWQDLLDKKVAELQTFIRLTSSKKKIKRPVVLKFNHLF